MDGDTVVICFGDSPTEARAKSLGIYPEWMVSNKDYYLGSDIGEFGGLSTKEQKQYLRRAILRGTKVGNIVKGKPVGLRKPSRA